MRHEFKYGSDKVTIIALTIEPLLEYLMELKPTSYRWVE